MNRLLLARFFGKLAHNVLLRAPAYDHNYSGKLDRCWAMYHNTLDKTRCFITLIWESDITK